MQKYGTTTRTDYVRHDTSGGIEGSVSYGLEWAAGGKTSEHDHWDLDRAQIKDPGDRTYRPWFDCEKKK